MLSLLSIAPGGREVLVLSGTAAPAAGPGQVVARVAACALSYPGSPLIGDRYRYRPIQRFAREVHCGIIADLDSLEATA